MGFSGPTWTSSLVRDSFEEWLVLRRKALEPANCETHQQIALVLSLQEGPQFRLGNIEIVGLDSALETELRSKIMSGEILNYQLIADFYRDHKSELPEEVLPQDIEFHRNMKERTADALFDFRSCSQLQNLKTSILPVPNHSASAW
jgi:hypothetical protein